MKNYNISSPMKFKQVMRLQSYLYEDNDHEKKEDNQEEDQSLEKKEDDKNNGVVWDRVKFGPYGWKVLHVYAANYPHDPCNAQQEKIKLFLQLFAEFYPCSECGTHFKKMLDTYPVKNSNRSEFREYVCFLHNEVNQRLNKTIFDCSKHEEVYGNPGGGCGCKHQLSNSTQSISEQKNKADEDYNMRNLSDKQEQDVKSQINNSTDYQYDNQYQKRYLKKSSNQDQDQQEQLNNNLLQELDTNLI